MEAQLQLVHGPVINAAPSLTTVEIRVERRVLAKRLWRGVAADGRQFGFELERPLSPGDVVWLADGVSYVIVQEPEPVLEIALAGLPASAAAGIGWAVGNLHLDLSSEAGRLLAPDEPAARRLLERIRIDFTPTLAVFRPGRFKRGGAVPQVEELGPGHKHGA